MIYFCLLLGQTRQITPWWWRWRRSRVRSQRIKHRTHKCIFLKQGSNFLFPFYRHSFILIFQSSLLFSSSSSVKTFLAPLTFSSSINTSPSNRMELQLGVSWVLGCRSLIHLPTPWVGPLAPLLSSLAREGPGNLLNAMHRFHARFHFFFNFFDFDCICVSFVCLSLSKSCLGILLFLPPPYFERALFLELITCIVFSILFMQ